MIKIQENISRKPDWLKVKINITQWDTIKVIDSIVYNDESFCAETGETEGKALRCWIAWGGLADISGYGYPSAN